MTAFDLSLLAERALELYEDPEWLETTAEMVASELARRAVANALENESQQAEVTAEAVATELKAMLARQAAGATPPPTLTAVIQNALGDAGYILLDQASYRAWPHSGIEEVLLVRDAQSTLLRTFRITITPTDEEALA